MRTVGFVMLVGLCLYVVWRPETIAELFEALFPPERRRNR